MNSVESIAVQVPEFAVLEAPARLFVLHYVADPRRVATRAVLEAGLASGKNYAAVKGHDLLRDPKVSAAIKAIERNQMTEEALVPRVFQRLLQIALKDQYVSKRDPDEPLLPGMEDAFLVKVNHSDSIAAAKTALAMCGLKIADKLEISGTINAAGADNLSGAAAELLAELNQQKAGEAEMGASGDDSQNSIAE